MSQNDMTIANSTGANVRADINSALQAIATNNSGSSAPSTTFATQFFADTNAGIMKLRNTSNNGYVNLFTLAGGIDVDAASTFSEDVTFEGASANIIFDKSDNQLEFADNVNASFGNGGDLKLFHNGTNSHIHSATGELDIRTGDFHLRNEANNEDMITATQNGPVELFYDGARVFETDSASVKIRDNIKANFGTGNDMSLFHNGTDSIIDNATGNLKIIAPNDVEAIKIFNDGTVNIGGNADNVLLRFGLGSDLTISHNGTNSIITNNTGVLAIQSGNLQLQDQANSHPFLTGVGDGAVELYFDNSKKLQTTSSGVTVTGTVTETSDIALKSDIQPLTNTLEKIQQITGYKYNLISSISPSMGVIAQDVEKVFPELVHGVEGKKTLQYSGLIGVLVEAVKDLSAKVAALEAA
tara:strand:+ start:1869 stop:3107 length:1239 start_codon:yes stop_codon:yes gene_type:complete